MMRSDLNLIKLKFSYKMETYKWVKKVRRYLCDISVCYKNEIFQ